MNTPPLDPQADHDRLYRTLEEFHSEWQHRRSARAFLTFCEDVERAAKALKGCEQQKTGQGKDFRVHTLRLRMLMTAAYQALQRVEEETVQEIGERMASEAPKSQDPGTVFAAGTIVSCPQCGEGLYKLSERATMQQVVLDAGTVLAPLNQTIPTREAWRALACPFCGGRYCKDGKLHTVQHGWR
jgi:hypothetical protein